MLAYAPAMAYQQCTYMYPPAVLYYIIGSLSYACRYWNRLVYFTWAFGCGQCSCFLVWSHYVFSLTLDTWPLVVAGCACYGVFSGLSLSQSLCMTVAGDIDMLLGGDREPWPLVTSAPLE